MTVTTTPSSSIRESVKEYYGEVLKTSDDLKTTACNAKERPAPVIREALSVVPDKVMGTYYGCGFPIPLDIFEDITEQDEKAEPYTVLDLGSGSGRDCFVIAHLLAQRNHKVIGLDMTVNQLAIARDNIDTFRSNSNSALEKAGKRSAKSVIEFRQGFIEDLKGAGIEDDSVDLFVSNCVINLSPNKRAVLQGVYDALKVGGEFYFSDMYCDRRRHESARSNAVLYGEGLGGALYVEDFKDICRDIGFCDPRIYATRPIDVVDETLKGMVGNARFRSITFRLFKLAPDVLESRREDYGQVACYKGSLSAYPFKYSLDGENTFIKDKPIRVCGNTAAILEDTRLMPHFTVTGNRNQHFGAFSHATTPPTK